MYSFLIKWRNVNIVVYGNLIVKCNLKTDAWNPEICCTAATRLMWNRLNSACWLIFHADFFQYQTFQKVLSGTLSEFQLFGSRSGSTIWVQTWPCSAVGNMSDFRYVSDCRSRVCEFDPGPVPYFVEIDHEIISTTILLPSADSRKVVVSYMGNYVHKVLLNRLVKLSQEKVWLGELNALTWP